MPGQKGVVATDVDDSQIYYGPSSSYVLAQHIRRIILRPPTSESSPDSRTPQDVGPVLDTFMQRHLYFGPPPRADAFATPLLHGNQGIIEILPQTTAARFLDNFNVATLNILPFFTCQHLSMLLNQMYLGANEDELPSQRRALLLVVLAIGALSEADTKLAETLFLAARQESELHVDVVSLETVQFSLLVAEYQVNMGRGASLYLAIGAACRKAFAMGLTGIPSDTPGQGALDEQRRVTIWSAYFMDSWYSIMGGRKRMIGTRDIMCQHPQEHALLTSLCQIASFLEEIADLIYDEKPKRLHDLYKSADDIYSRLRKWAGSVGIGSITTAKQRPLSETMALLTLHNSYFQAVQVLFRPFVVAEYALPSTAQETSELWLRHACRHATDAATDCIVFFQATFQTLSLPQLRRRDAFFLEISCSLLLLESLRHPSKHANNAIYINSALSILKEMPADVPVTALIQSTQSIADAVQSSIAQRRNQVTSRLSPVESHISVTDMSATGSLARFDAASVDEYLQASVDNQAASSATDTESFLSSLSHEEINAMMAHPFDFSMF